MTAATLKALKGSIKKWEEIVAGKGADFGRLDCPLCKLFNRRDGHPANKDCLGCPVRERTRWRWCYATPFQGWKRHHKEAHLLGGAKRVFCPTCKKLAQAEVDFLKSLLPGKPKGEKK